MGSRADSVLTFNSSLKKICQKKINIIYLQAIYKINQSPLNPLNSFMPLLRLIYVTYNCRKILFRYGLNFLKLWKVYNLFGC